MIEINFFLVSVWYRLKKSDQTRRSKPEKGERETKDHVEKDCRKRERQGGMEGLHCSHGGGTPQGGLGGQRDGLMCLGRHVGATSDDDDETMI